jgi:hypothetical protein
VNQQNQIIDINPETTMDPIFKGDTTQMRLLKEAFKRNGITNGDVMNRLGKEFLGRPMAQMDIFIEVAMAEGRADAPSEGNG